jgi:hypothetical protein
VIPSVHLENLGDYAMVASNASGSATTSVLVRDSAAFSTFKNLDFESALVAKPLNLAGPSLPPSQALPGWTVISPIGVVIDNVYERGEVALFDDSFYQLPPLGKVGGHYTVCLMGAVPNGSGIAQTAHLCSGARLLHFKASQPTNLFDISIAGQVLTCSFVSSSTDYANYEYQADISSFAGQTAELRVTSKINFCYIDDICFSGQPVSSCPTIVVSQEGDANIVLSFPAQSGTRYSIQATTDLFNWSTITNIQSTSNVVQFIHVGPPNARTMFYRLLVPP